MSATRYTVAATPSYPAPKVVSTAKAARNEAEARAKGDRVDVQVRTQSTDKLVYTALGAPTMTEMPAAPAPAEAPVAPAAPVETAPPAMDDLIREVKAEAAAKDPQRKAPCGCLVERIISSGEHGQGCANAPAQAAAAVAVKRDPAPQAPRAPRAPRTGGGSTGRRASLGEAAVTGWELLYDKPKQGAQVGRRDGKYALICTAHLTVRQLDRLVQERTLRNAGGWCPSCNH